MKRLLGTLVCLTMMLFLAAAAVSCGTTAVTTSPWGGLGPNEVFYLGEGGTIKASQDGVAIADIRVEGGHLYLNDRDLGAYELSQGIRFLPDGTLTVDGQTRGRLGDR